MQCSLSIYLLFELNAIVFSAEQSTKYDNPPHKNDKANLIDAPRIAERTNNLWADSFSALFSNRFFFQNIALNGFAVVNLDLFFAFVHLYSNWTEYFDRKCNGFNRNIYERMKTKHNSRINAFSLSPKQVRTTKGIHATRKFGKSHHRWSERIWSILLLNLLTFSSYVFTVIFAFGISTNSLLSIYIIKPKYTCNKCKCSIALCLIPSFFDQKITTQFQK